MACKLAPLLLSAMCGLALMLPFRSYDGSLPAWVALAPMFWLTARLEKTRCAVLCAFVFALAWTVPSFTFLWHLTAPGTVALAIYTSLFYVGALLAVRRLARCGVVPAVFGTAAVWALVELLRATVPILGFPWLLLGHTLLHAEHLRQGADLLGVYGLSFLIAAVNAWLAFALPAWLPQRWQAVPHADRKRPWPVSVLTAALLLSAFVYGAARISALRPRLQAGPLIGVIQGDIAQKLGRSDEELGAQLRGHLELHRQVIAAARQATGDPPALVCWAETMVPGSLNVDEWGAAFKREVAASGVPTLAGSNLWVFADAAVPGAEPRCYNAAYLFDGGGNELLRYFKRRLVPFGEYIPLAERFPVLKCLRSITRDQYAPGAAPSPVCTVPQTAAPGTTGYRIAVNICVEDIHPDLAREAVLAGADTLVNLTNDGWFYHTFGPRSHMVAAAWRAIEVRRPLLRVTNTGRTVAVDPLGRIETLIPAETVGTACVRLQRIAADEAARSAGSPHTVALWLGDLGMGVVFLLVLGGSLLARRTPPLTFCQKGDTESGGTHATVIRIMI
ncbi:MAG: apolipoprotein N-acyltransferase [Planctomycetota bacterium]|nr:apolipoprotein N-acyltransferase [Planctomycetota bacterium]